VKITKVLLKEWAACADGRTWFTKNFPQGADYGDVLIELRKQKHLEWVTWLTDKAYRSVFENPAGIASLVAEEVATTQKETEGSPESSSGNYSKAASSGDGSTAASSGDGSTAASSGYGSKAAAVGLRGRSKAGDNGCFALFWNDGKRDRITVAYVGEDGVKADTWYRLNDTGTLVECVE
jgi:hypothetical protein